MALTNGSHSALHVARDLSLVALSIAFLPPSCFLVLLARVAKALSLVAMPQRSIAIYNGRQVRVLVTGVGMAKGLFLARCLHIGGCAVIVADIEKHGVPVCGKFSEAVEKFYTLRVTSEKTSIDSYTKQFLQIIKNEKIDLWISCSGVATAMEDAELMQKIESETSCKTFQFNEEVTFKLDNKYEFMKTTASLGLPVPRWGSLTTPEDAEQIVKVTRTQVLSSQQPDFILKNVSMDDRTRGALPLLSADRPKQMTQVLDSLDYNGASWIMQQFIPGKEEYCTQALIVNGHVRAFLACPSASVLMHYETLDVTSPLFQAMLRFTQTYATGMFSKYGQFSGHLSFDFLALDEPTVDGMKKTLLPIECNPRCHTAVVHFRGMEKELTSAYLSLLPVKQQQDTALRVPDLIVGNERPNFGYYWIAHDLIVLFILPLVQVILSYATLRNAVNHHFEFWKHALLWKDPTFEWWDPLPWFVLNHVYWPGHLLMASLLNVHWSQINVSTGKMFVM